MIGRLQGQLIAQNPPQVLVDCHGVGYEVDVPMSTYYNLPGLGEKVTLLGTADSNRTVSEALRALDGAGTRPELLSIRQEGGTVHFEVALAPTSLTRG